MYLLKKAPRKIDSKILYKICPCNLQIMIIIIPFIIICIIVCAYLWWSPLEMLLPTIFILIYCPYYLWEIIKVKTLFVNGNYLKACISRIIQGENSFSGCFIIEYSYNHDDSIYESEYMVTKIEGYGKGDFIYVLINPRKPGESIPYLVN